MAVTKGAMTSLPTSQTIFLQAIEEPEHNSINFRDSLKFFQEQLVINGANFPSPSPVCRNGNDTMRKNGPRSLTEQNVKMSTHSDIFEEEISLPRSCKISIPTVDTILESVRVLRAIQKSQEERGSSWNLDVTSKPDADSDFNYTDEWVQISDINHTFSNNESKSQNLNQEKLINSEDKLETTRKINTANNDIKHSENDLHSSLSFSNTENKICSFWPSNTLGTSTNKECAINNASSSIETLDACQKMSSHITNREDLATKYLESVESFRDNFVEKTIDMNTSESSDNLNYDALFDEDVTENFTRFQNKVSDGDINTETCSMPDSLRSVCKNLLNSLNEDSSKETELKGPESATGVLKIETYDGMDASKHDDDFLLNPLWKENCSPNGSNSTKLEHNDSDSGIGTQRSTSSLSANNPNHMQKDSWSDTCSSHYASAECSPYHSLNSVFETSLGLNTTQGETKEIQYAESSAHLISSVLENEENVKETYDDYQEISELLEQTGSELENATEKLTEYIKEEDDEHQELEQTGSELENATEKLTEYIKEEDDEHQELEQTGGELENATEKLTEHIKKADDEHEELARTGSLLENTTEKLTEHIKEADDEHQELEQTENEFKKEPENTKESDDGHQQNSQLSEETNGKDLTENQYRSSVSEHEYHSPNAELDAEISYCSFISNYTIENPASIGLDEQSISQDCDIPKIANGLINDHNEETNNGVETRSLVSVCSKDEESDDSSDLGRIQKFTANSCDLISIVESLYTIKENPAYQVIPLADGTETKFEETLFILSKGAFCEHPEDDYAVIIEDYVLHITKESQDVLSLNMKYGEVSFETKNILKIDNRLGRCVYIRCGIEETVNVKRKIELHCLKHWQTDCLQLVHYPLKCHQDVVIIDLGSCSTRAGILMDQPTLPSLFFPTICATDKRTGTCVYGMEALQPEVRQHSNLSFPVRPTIKITKHTIDIDLLEGLFKKVFNDLKVDPTQYTVQVCLPRNLSISAQIALVKLLLEGLKVKAVSLTNQALLTLYAHEVSTAVVVDIGDRTDVLPVVDGFIVENGVTRLPHGGQRLIHHMRHGLAEKRITLSTDIDSFVVQYIIENLAYVADDYDNEIQTSSRFPDIVKKTIALQPASSECTTGKSITLEEARFKIPEGLFNPDLWGLDSPGIHHLVQKAIQATSVDVRKKIAENIYVSGGVSMLPGFVERLNKEVAKLSKTKIVPKVYASNYRYHCTYIGACKFAKMEVFPQVCINLKEYTENKVSALKKCALYF